MLVQKSIFRGLIHRMAQFIMPCRLGAQLTYVRKNRWQGQVIRVIRRVIGHDHAGDSIFGGKGDSKLFSMSCLRLKLWQKDPRTN